MNTQNPFDPLESETFEFWLHLMGNRQESDEKRSNSLSSFTILSVSSFLFIILLDIKTPQDLHPGSSLVGLWSCGQPARGWVLYRILSNQSKPPEMPYFNYQFKNRIGFLFPDPLIPAWVMLESH